MELGLWNWAYGIGLMELGIGQALSLPCGKGASPYSFELLANGLTATNSTIAYLLLEIDQ